MYPTIESFLSDWAYESEATLKNLELLTDESLAFKPVGDVRGLNKIAWHIVGTLHEMPTASGLKVDNFEELTTEPHNVKKMIEIYKHLSTAIADLINEQWNDEMLKGEIEMYGMKWTRADMLKSLVYHQIHHRGQMTVLMRLAGLKVHGIYGPSKEEWEQFNMPPQE